MVVRHARATRSWLATSRYVITSTVQSQAGARGRHAHMTAAVDCSTVIRSWTRLPRTMVPHVPRQRRDDATRSRVSRLTPNVIVIRSLGTLFRCWQSIHRLRVNSAACIRLAARAKAASHAFMASRVNARVWWTAAVPQAPLRATTLFAYSTRRVMKALAVRTRAITIVDTLPQRAANVARVRR